MRVARAGLYSVWLGGSTRGPLSVYVDGRSVGDALEEIQEAGQYLPFGQISLRAGRIRSNCTMAGVCGGPGWAARPNRWDRWCSVAKR